MELKKNSSAVTEQQTKDSVSPWDMKQIVMKIKPLDFYEKAESLY